MNVEDTSLPEGIQSASELSAYGYDETTLITAPTKPVFKNGKKVKVTKEKNKKVDEYRCPSCLQKAKKLSMKTCEVCKDVGMAIFHFCKRCARKHDIVGSPFTHKAKWTTAFPEEVFQI